MSLTEDLANLPEDFVPAEFGRFQRHIDPVWIGEALVATGTATIRRRRLPAEQVVWIVLGMALMRNESIERVIETLNLALPSPKDEPTARSAIVQARQRLGEEPMAYLFATTADRWAHDSAGRHRWHGLALYGVDGTTIYATASYYITRTCVRTGRGQSCVTHYLLAAGDLVLP